MSCGKIKLRSNDIIVYQNNIEFLSTLHKQHIIILYTCGFFFVVTQIIIAFMADHILIRMIRFYIICVYLIIIIITFSSPCSSVRILARCLGEQSGHHSCSDGENENIMSLFIIQSIKTGQFQSTLIKIIANMWISFQIGSLKAKFKIKSAVNCLLHYTFTSR